MHCSTENSGDVECVDVMGQVADAGVRNARGAAAKVRRPTRVYLMAPSRWKSSRVNANALSMEWTRLAPAPSAWLSSRQPAVERPAFIAYRTDLCALAERASTYARPLFAALNANRLRQWGLVGFKRAQHGWLTWNPSYRRRALSGFSFGLVVAIAVPLGMVVAHPQPEWQKRSSAVPADTALSVMAAPSSISNAYVAPVLLPTVADLDGVTVNASASDSASSSLHDATQQGVTTTPDSVADAFVPDASTMDLMMPIAEPDLNIASHQSLWAQVGKEFGVDPLLLYSIALVESKSLHPGGELAPTPWLFRVNDHLVMGERHHVQMEMAVASQLNATVQDVGIMQVYYPMHRSAVRDPLSLLDPRTNISVAAKILHDGMHETRDPVLGVGYYHSHTQQLARDYGTAVMTVYQRLKMVYRSGKNAQVMAR